LDDVQSSVAVADGWIAAAERMEATAHNDGISRTANKITREAVCPSSIAVPVQVFTARMDIIGGVIMMVWDHMMACCRILSR